MFEENPDILKPRSSDPAPVSELVIQSQEIAEAFALYHRRL